jgi:iron complex outermembrane recepter protein
MKTHLKVSTAVAVLAIFGAGSAPLYAQDAKKEMVKEGMADEAVAQNDIGIKEILVTATRREESLNKVPLAIQALSGDSLADLNVTNFDKLIAYLPNVRTASRGPGSTSVYIRGLSTDTVGSQVAGTVGSQPSVALYLNDAPSALPGRNLDIYAADIQRVEVLAGPQGTLFGAGALAGVIRYITNKPNLNAFEAGFTGSISATKGGDNSYSGQGYINVPIIEDKLAIRFVAYNDNQGGYIDNVFGTYQLPFNPGSPGVLPSGNPLLVEQAIASCVGQPAGCTGSSNYTPPNRRQLENSRFVEDNYNDASYAGGRLAATFKISEDWSLEALHARQTLKTDGVFDYDAAVGDLKVQQFNNNTLEDTFDISTLTLNGRLGALDLLYTGSFINHRAIQNADYSRYSNIGLYLPYYECDRGVYYTGEVATAGRQCYAPDKSYRVDTKNTRATHEFRLNTPADKRIRATVGLFYDVNKIFDNTQWNYVQFDAGFIYPRTPNPTVNALNLGVVPVGVGFVNTIQRRDRQFAAFGEVSLDVVPDKLTVTGGLRYYDEKASIAGGSNSSFNGLGGPFSARGIYIPATATTPARYEAAAVPPRFFRASSNLSGVVPAKYSGVLYKGNITFRPTDSTLIYATVSNGLRPGGFNRKGCNGGFATANPGLCATLASYQPDDAVNYEIGAKLGLFDRRVQLNFAAYKIDWKDIQIAVFNQNVSNQTFNANLADARIYGFEGDVTVRVTSDFTLNSGFSYNDSKLTADRLRAAGLNALVPLGSPLALSPKFQGNVRLRYERELDSGLRPFAQVGLTFAGKTISSVIANTDVLYRGAPATINGVLVRPGDTVTPIDGSFEQRGYLTTSASFGASKDNWTLELFGENLGNERPQLFISGNDGNVRTTTSRPLTVGLRASFKM